MNELRKLADVVLALDEHVAPSRPEGTLLAALAFERQAARDRIVQFVILEVIALALSESSCHPDSAKALKVLHRLAAAGFAVGYRRPE